MACKRCGGDTVQGFDTCYRCMSSGLFKTINEQRAELGLPPICDGEFSDPPEPKQHEAKYKIVYQKPKRRIEGNETWMKI